MRLVGEEGSWLSGESHWTDPLERADLADPTFRLASRWFGSGDPQSELPAQLA